MHDLLVTNCKLINEGNIIECDILISKQRIENIRPDNCGWSPFEGHQFRSSIEATILNGQVVCGNCAPIEVPFYRQQLIFDR
jgi:dihydroorotase-like cyclic amidohydrolase